MEIGFDHSGVLSDLDRLYVRLRVRQSDIRNILIALGPAPDTRSVSGMARECNIPEVMIWEWVEMSNRVLGAYALDSFRPGGFVLATIVDEITHEHVSWEGV